MADSHTILFDLDGTLIDNEHLKAQAFSKAIEEIGGRSDPAIYKDVMGQSGPVIRERFIQESNIQVDPEEYFNLYKSIYEESLQTGLVIRPGVIQFLDEIRSAGISMAVVSGSYERAVNGIIKSLDLGQYLDLVITGDDVKSKKPSPESYLMALEELSLVPELAVVFEDTEAGLRSANQALIKSLGIRHAYNQSHDFSDVFNEYSSFKEESELMKRDINLIFNKAIL